MDFRYKKLAPTITRPIIPVKIIFNGKEVNYEALIDSGADECIFDAEIGQAIGVPIRKGEYKITGGIGGGKFPYYLHKVTISVGGHEIKTTIGFMPNFQSPHSVLGQNGFFDLFIVKFDKKKEQIELKIKN